MEKGSGKNGFVFDAKLSLGFMKPATHTYGGVLQQIAHLLHKISERWEKMSGDHT
jgi:hypothetical protein